MAQFRRGGTHPRDNTIFLFQFPPTPLRARIKRLFHVESEERSRAQLGEKVESAVQEAVMPQLQAEPRERTLHRAALIGETCPEEHGITLAEKDQEIPLEHPRTDPFWKAFGQALASGE